MSELIPEIEQIKLNYRSDRHGNQSTIGTYFMITIKTTIFAGGKDRALSMQCIVEENKIDDFAMDVAAEIDGAKDDL